MFDPESVDLGFEPMDRERDTFVKEESQRHLLCPQQRVEVMRPVKMEQSRGDDNLSSG